MSQAIQIPVTQVGLEQSIAAAMRRAGNSSQINLGTNSRQINALSQPLGRITGQADEFSKSMEAANARVLAFGASAGIIAGVSSAMAGLVRSTIEVEKRLVEVNAVLGASSAELDKFGQDIFNVAKNTGKSFAEVSTAALELARQGLSAEDTLTRLNDAMILSRLSGLDATKSVEGLTAAFNSFKSSGISTAEILDNIVAAAQKFAVSEKDIIEALGRSASVADLAGVSFNELAAIVTAVQEKTARGGAVIGNSLKTIFARIQDKSVLSDLQDMGIAVTNLQGEVLPALKILENLAAQMDGFSQIEQADISKKLGGVYQLDKLLAALKDLSSESSVYRETLKEIETAAGSAYKKNAVLNETLAALINKVAVSAEQLGAKLGEIGVTDNLKNILGFFNNLLEGIQKVLGEESGLGTLVRGLVKGLGNFLSGPGLALFGAIILKLSKDLVQFGFASLKAFFGIGKAAKDVQNVESAISQILSKNVNLQQQLFALEGNRAAQLRVITTALVEQEALLRRSAAISSGLAAPLYGAGVRAGSSGLRIGNSAGGYMPAIAKESQAINSGVGGARRGDKPVVMPNFNFGGGKKGTVVAHTGEYVVPNFGGGSGSAIFNRNMVQKMGLPDGAKKITASGGLIPNFKDVKITKKVSEFSSLGRLVTAKKVDSIDSFTSLISPIEQNLTSSEYTKKAQNQLKEIVPKFGRNNLRINKEKLDETLEFFKKAGVDNTSIQTFKSAVQNLDPKRPTSGQFLNIQNRMKGILGEIDASEMSGQKLNQGNSFLDLSDGSEVKTVKSQKASEILKKGINQYLLSSNIYDGEDNKTQLGKIPVYLPKGTPLLNSAGGFIPNFALYYDEQTGKMTDKFKSTPTIPGNWSRVEYNSEDARRALEAGTLEQNKLPGRDFYLFRNEDGSIKSGGYGAKILQTSKASRSQATVNKIAAEDKVAKAGFYNIDADKLGGIALISPVFGSEGGRFDTKTQLADIPYFASEFKKGEKSRVIKENRNKFVILKGVQKANTPSGKDLQEVHGDISKLFAAPIVALAHRLYGGTFDPASRGNFRKKLRSLDLDNKQELLPPAAQGSIFEAAGKVALNTLANIESLFGTGDTKPFDFHNKEAMKKMFDVDAVRGEAKRGGEKGQGKGGGDKFLGSRQVSGLIKKVFNDQELGPKAIGILQEKGVFESQAQAALRASRETNAFGGFIPNFSAGRSQLSDLISQFANSARRFPDVPQLSTQQNELLRRRIQQIRLAGGSPSRPLLISSLASDIERQAGSLALNSLLPSLSSIVKSRLPSLDDIASPAQTNSSNDSTYLGKKISERSASSLLLDPSGKLKVGMLSSLKGNPLFELARLVKKREIKSIDAGAIVGPRVPSIILGLQKIVASERAKDPTYPRIPIDGFFNPKTLSEKVNSKSEAKMRKLNPGGFTQDSYYPLKAGSDYFSKKDQKSLITSFRKFGTKRNDSQYLNLKDYFPQGLAGGFVPNFASPLQDAVGREMAAGVPASQIYIDKSPALKNAANPMGLMVANRRDEPAGGFQGINRARKEGANPMMYGAAGGFVPNYAEANVQPYIGQTRTQALDAEKNDYRNALKELARQLRESKKDLMHTKAEEVEQRLALEDRIKSLKENAVTLKAQSQATRKAIQEQTRGVLGSGRSLTGGQARVTGQSAGGGSRDILGTVFAVQGALSGLTGATEGATGGIGFFTNTLSSAAGTATTAIFATQGLSQAFPKFASVLGPAGLAIGGLTAAYQIGTTLFNKYSGITSAVAVSVEAMGKAAEGATISLSTLGAARKEEIKKRAKDIGSDLSYGEAEAAYTMQVYGRGGSQTITGGGNKKQATFEGEIGGVLNNELRKQYDSVIENAIAQQVPEGVIKEQIAKIKDDGIILASELKSFSAAIADEMINASKEVTIFLNSISEDANGVSTKLAAMSEQDFAALLDTSTIQDEEKRAKSQGYESVAELKKAYKDGSYEFRGDKLPARVQKQLGITKEQFDAVFQGLDDKQIGDVLTTGRRKSKASQNQREVEEPQKERSFQINLGKIEAEIKLNQKLNAQKKAIFITEQTQKEALAKIENDMSLSENDRLKAVAAINSGYGQSIALLTEQEQKTKNIGDALVGGLTGVPGILGDQIAGFAEKISAQLPTFDIKNITAYKTALEGVFKAAELPQDAYRPLTEGLIQAEIANKAISDEREKQIDILEKEYGIQIKSINASSDKLSLEKQISAQIEARNSEASFKIENRVLNNAYETLSINKEIERIKRETSLNELQKAEQVYKLELKRRDLESTGIGIGLEQNLLDIDQELINKAREAIKSSGKIVSGGLRADLTIEDLQALASVDDAALEEVKLAIANAQRQRDLARKKAGNEQAGLGDVEPDDIMDRASKGFFGGLSRGVTALQNQTNTFASDIGEKIPQMFSDNMSSAINKMIEGGESFSDVLRGAAYEFVKGINQANIQNLSNNFSNFLFNKNDGTGGTGGGLFGFLSGMFGSGGMAAGGMINGGSGSKDDVPAMLMGGEYVVNKKAVSKYGAQFLESINNGTLTGYAQGGAVQRGPQGNFYIPGTFGQGAIEGKTNLLDFATQTGTSGQFDKMINQSGYQAIDLEPESSRLSVSGMRNSPQFEATQSAKQQAFDLYLQQYNAELEAKKAEKEQKKAFRKQLMMLAISAVAAPVLGAAGAGFGAAFKGASGQGIMSQLGAGFKGIFTGGSIGGQQVGGLGNLFSSVGKAFTGDFAGAGNQFKLSQIGNSSQLVDLYKSDKGFASYIDKMGGFDTSGAPRAIPVSEIGGGISSGIARSGKGGIAAGQSGYGKGVIQDAFGNTPLLTSGGFGGKRLVYEDSFGYGDQLYGKRSYLLGVERSGSSRFGGNPLLPKATGGMIPSTSGIDTVPAMLSGGEFVMNRSAVQGIGAQNLQSMNSGGTSITSEETSKELNEKLLAKLDELIKASGSTGDITINVAPSGQTTQETSQDPSAGRQQLARQIRDAVLQVINDEKRIGGALRR